MVLKQICAQLEAGELLSLTLDSSVAGVARDELHERDHSAIDTRDHQNRTFQEKSGLMFDSEVLPW